MNRKSSTLQRLARQQDVLARAAEVELGEFARSRDATGARIGALAEMAGSTRHAEMARHIAQTSQALRLAQEAIDQAMEDGRQRATVARRLEAALLRLAARHRISENEAAERRDLEELPISVETPVRGKPGSR
ncbi:MAG: hypothetical protein U1E28_10990 [Beijerinckiaceae bacterium]